VTTNTLGFLGTFGLFVLVAQYMQLVLGLSPLEAGLWSLPSSAAFIVGAMLAPTLFPGVRPAYVIGGGLALAAIGFAVLSQAGGISYVVAGSVIFALGLSPVAGMSTELIVGAAPPERSGAASAISETSAEFGGALGIALLGSLGTAVYRSQMADAVPEGVPTAAAEAARDTPGGAAASGEGLSDGLATELLDAAGHAFTQALQTTALASAALTAATAVLATVMLRRVRIGKHAEPSAA
jgi:MFS transporter, DHA2 family, multidrug resistance protein